MPIAVEVMLMRKSLFLLLTCVLVAVPVFLMAHAFTHYAQTGVEDVPENEEGIDLDEICLDCLALAGFHLLLVIAAFLLNQVLICARLPLWSLVRVTQDSHHFYFSRAPPTCPT